jgi:hypothetical protein
MSDDTVALSTEPVAIGSNGYAIRVGDRVRCGSAIWRVAAIISVPDSANVSAHTEVSLISDDPDLPDWEGAVSVLTREVYLVGTPNEPIA